MSVATAGLKNYSITVGSVTADTTVTQNVGRRYLFLQNLHATAKVYLRIDQTTTGGGTAVTAVAGAAGTIMLGPGDSMVWETTFIPTGALSIISDTSSTPVTILEG
jgi:hypothetical protein